MHGEYFAHFAGRGEDTLKILVTGECGFVGAQLAFHLQHRGHQVVVADNLVRRGGELNLPRFQRHGVEFVHLDVRNPEDLAGLPRGIDLICDASAQPSVVTGYANPLFDITNNSLGLVHVLEFARKRGCPLIFWSSNRVYSADRTNAPPHSDTATRLVWDKDAYSRQFAGNPIVGFDPDRGFSEEFTLEGKERSIYGLRKLMADLACQEYAGAFRLKTVINRFGVISGEGQFGSSDQGWVAWWAIAFYFGLPLKYVGWEGKQVRDIVFIEDVCRLVDLETRILTVSPEKFLTSAGARQTPFPWSRQLTFSARSSVGTCPSRTSSRLAEPIKASTSRTITRPSASWAGKRGSGFPRDTTAFSNGFARTKKHCACSTA